MKKEDVPQDNSRTYGGERKLMYAVDVDGKYSGVESSGWDVETYATIAAVELLEAQRDAALTRGLAGETSPLEFHMFDKRMDMATLTSSTGYGVWRVKRHLKPSIFNALPDKKLEPYCEAMGLDLATLKSLPPKQDKSAQES